MIDTIVIRIHNIQKYPALYEQYYSPTKKRKTTQTALVDEDLIKAAGTNKVNAIIYHDSGKFLPIVTRSTINLPSSHYTLSTCLKNDYLEFDFSIPKYLYGNNVMQFVNSYDTSAHVMFLELKKFIYTFIKKHCLYQEPEPEDIEINRIDLCYNQIFNTKNDALEYMEQLKKVNATYARKNSKNGARDWRTSFSYVTKRYSFKGYHKGTEFKENDLQKIAKKNLADLPLQYITDMADRTIRYEMTFRRSMIRYLTDHYFFVSGEKNLHAEYSEHVISQFSKSLVTTIGTRAYDAFKGREKKFTMRSWFDYCDDLNILKESDCITFDETIFTILFNTFWKKVEEYQVSQAFDVNSIVSRIEKYNDTTRLQNHLRRKPISCKEKSRLIIAALLAQNFEMEKLKPYIPRTTLYNLKKDLKKLDISTTDTKLSFGKPRTDYQDYRIYFLKLHNKFNHN